MDTLDSRNDTFKDYEIFLRCVMPNLLELPAGCDSDLNVT